MLIEYNGQSIETNLYVEVSEEERKQLKSQYFSKPNFIDVQKQLKKLSSDGQMMDKVNKYYFRELMAQTLCYKCKWTVEDVFNSKELLGIFKAKTLTNKNVFPDSESLIRNIDTAIRLGGKSYAKFPTNYPIKSVRTILSKYSSANNNYYDFSCGWGARLLGALSMNKNYYGTDPNYLLIKKLQELTNDYKKIIPNTNSVDLRAQGSEIFIPEWENKMGIAFSSPPYYNLEDYKIGEQSYKPGVTYELWLENYLKPTISNIYKYLIDSAYFCINIKNIENYLLINDTKNIAEKNGFTFVTAELLNNNTRNTPNGAIDNNEYIYIFQKNINTNTKINIPQKELITIEAQNDNYGWICPKCKRIYSPRIDFCSYCSNIIK